MAKNEFIESRLSSNKLEDIQWRINHAEDSSRIEGIKTNPKHETFMQNLRNEGITEKEIRKRFIEMVKNKN